MDRIDGRILRRMGDRRAPRALPASGKRAKSYPRIGEGATNVPPELVAEDELFAPGVLCPLEQQDAFVVKLMFGTDTETLGQQGAKPGVVVVYVFAEASAGTSERKEGGRGKVGGNVGERFLWEEEKEGSMLKLFVRFGV